MSSGTRSYDLVEPETPTKTAAPDDQGGRKQPKGGAPAPSQTAWGSASSSTGGTAGGPDDAMKLIEDEEHILLGALDEAKKASGPSSSGAAPACGRACTALASMRRSVARLCELTASSDRRCEEAKGRLGKDEALVKQARCECSTP